MISMMNDLFQYWWIESGQFIIGDSTKIRLTPSMLWTLVRKELEYFQQFKPLEKTFNLEINQYYDFTADSNNPGFAMTDGTITNNGYYPRSITECIPLGTGNIFTTQALFLNPMLRKDYGNPNFLRDPLPFLTEYQKTKPLFLESMSGRFQISAAYDYMWTEVMSTDTIPVLTDVLIPDLEHKETVFFDMVSAKILQAVALTRGSFINTQLSITTNAPVLLQKAQDDYKEAKRMCHAQQKVYQTVRPG